MLERSGWVVLLTVSAAAIVGVFVFVPPIPQDPAYHAFADRRGLLGVPNFADTMSNLAFVVAGILGARRARSVAHVPHLVPYTVFWVAVVLVGLGSGFYHLNPSTYTLVFDRLPMTIGFMGIIALVVGDRVSPRAGYALLWPLVMLGLASVIYWYWTETQGVGDLRAYALVQLLPMLLLPLLLLATPRSLLRSGWLWLTLVAYGLAKVTEHFDVPIFALTGSMVSGHTLKHLLAAFAVYFAMLAVPVRDVIAARSPSAR